LDSKFKRRLLVRLESNRSSVAKPDRLGIFSLCRYYVDNMTACIWDIKKQSETNSIIQQMSFAKVGECVENQLFKTDLLQTPKVTNVWLTPAQATSGQGAGASA
jgi:hypothetical protein